MVKIFISLDLLCLFAQCIPFTLVISCRKWGKGTGPMSAATWAASLLILETLTLIDQKTLESKELHGNKPNNNCPPKRSASFNNSSCSWKGPLSDKDCRSFLPFRFEALSAFGFSFVQPALSALFHTAGSFPQMKKKHLLAASTCQVL